MTYKMVFLDVDGTILDSRNQLDDQLSTAIHELKERGILFALATGRSVEGARLYGDRLGISDIVAYNGGYVLSGEEVVCDVKIPGQLAGELCKKTSELGGTFIHFSYHKSISNQAALPVEFLLPEARFLDGDDIFHDAHRVVLYLNRESREKLQAGIHEAAVFDEGDRLEVFPTGSKWTGIHPLIEKLGILPSEVVAIGNGSNDLGMIIEAGLGIAMKNSPPSLLQKADWVTKDLDHNGVTVALRKVFHLQKCNNFIHI